jgi:hypothetical protein
MVAATIGFGGAGGIASLASGPSQSAVADPPGPLSGHRSLESITASLPLSRAKSSPGGGGPLGPGPVGPGGTIPSTSPGGQASSPGGGSLGGGSSPGSGGQPPNPSTGLPTIGVPTQGPPGVNQLLHSLGLGP